MLATANFDSLVYGILEEQAPILSVDLSLWDKRSLWAVLYKMLSVLTDAERLCAMSGVQQISLAVLQRLRTGQNKSILRELFAQFPTPKPEPHLPYSDE